MKNKKKFFAILIISLAVLATSLTAYAVSDYSTPAEIVGRLTGRTSDSVIAEKTENQKTYGAIADEAGKFTEFKEEMLELKKDKIAAQVEAGKITQEKADTMVKALEEKQAACDGTGITEAGQSMKGKFGSKGMGQGIGGGKRGQGRGHHGQGGGQNKGRGGMGLQDGSCHMPAN